MGVTWANGGEDGRTRSSFSPEASPFGERRSGPRDLGQVGGDREVHVGFDTYHHHAQDGEPVEEGGEGFRIYSGPDQGAGREVEDLQRVLEDQVQRTRCSVQGQEEAARGQEYGDQGEDWPLETRDPKGSHQTGGRRAPCRSSGGTRAGRDEDRPDFGLGLRRGGSEQKSDKESRHQSVSTEGSQVGSLDGEHGQQAMRPRFASLVNTILYDKEAPEHYVNFSAPLMGLRSWENKPWALHGGDFLDRSAHAFFQKLLATQTPKSPFEEVDPIRVSGEIQLMFAFPPELPHGDRVAGLFPELPLGDLAAGLSPELSHGDRPNT